jgi:hypothetical protein
MIRTAATVALLSLTLSVVPVRAEEVRGADAAAVPNTGEIASPAAAEATASPRAAETVTVASSTYPALSGSEWLAARHRPSALPGLYASFAALQMFDAYSTNKALAGGGREANPFMKTVVGNRAMFWSIKAATTVAPMMAAERLWKRNKVAAIAVMAASNGIMAAVAAHNAGVIRSQQ